MGKVVPALFPIVKGKVGKVVFCKRDDGAYVREWVMPNDPKTPAQLTHREIVRQAGIAWRALSEAEQAEYKARAPRGSNGYRVFFAEFVAKAGTTSQP